MLTCRPGNLRGGARAEFLSIKVRRLGRIALVAGAAIGPRIRPCAAAPLPASPAQGCRARGPARPRLTAPPSRPSGAPPARHRRAGSRGSPGRAPALPHPCAAARPPAGVAGRPAPTTAALRRKERRNCASNGRIQLRGRVGRGCFVSSINLLHPSRKKGMERVKLLACDKVV